MASCENFRHVVIVDDFCSLFRDALHEDITFDRLRGIVTSTSAIDVCMSYPVYSQALLIWVTHC